MKNVIFGLALAMMIPAVAHAGRLGGEGATDDSVAPKKTQQHKAVFEGGVFAQVTVRGFGEGDIDCAVFDARGNAVDSDTDATNSCMLMWMPHRDETFTVKVHNAGTNTVSYRLETN